MENEMNHPRQLDWSLEERNETIQERFLETVEQYPGRLALEGEGVSFTYLELNAAADSLASAILNRRGEGLEPIALMFSHGPEAIIAILATLKAGKFYVPIDPFSPKPRIQAILDDSGAALLVTDRTWSKLAQNFEDETVEVLEAPRVTSSLEAVRISKPVPPDSPLSIIYTSGSTGVPKGCVQTHRNALWEVGVTTRLSHYSLEDRFASIVPYTFGASIVNILALLLNGGSVITFDLKERGVREMASWLKEAGITIYYSVPTVFRHWMNALEEDEVYPRMRLIKLGGEPLLRRDLDNFRRHFTNGCVLRNALGTTENYLAACLILDRNFEFDGPVLPVGYPPEGKEILILDEAYNPLPSGEVGQIAIRSRYLSPGYWRRPDLTQAAYLADPEGGDERVYLTGDLGRLQPDGCLEHLGRMDDMVKIRGQRVELAELEMALLDLDQNLREVAVAALHNPQGENCLVAYLAPRDPDSLDVQALRRKLEENLPAHMLPAAFVTLKQLPLLPIGKVNRGALPPPDWNLPVSGRKVIAPRTPLEEEIYKVWGEIMGGADQPDSPVYGVEDNFFDLGGNSLQAAGIAARLREVLSMELPVQLIFEKGTIAGLAAYVEAIRSVQHEAREMDDDLARGLRLLGEV